MKQKLKYFFAIIFIAFFFTVVAKSEYWEKVTLPANTQNTLWLDVFFIDNTHGWVCGRYHNNVARTTDGGQTWSVTNLGNHFLERIHFADRLNGFVSGPSGVFKSTNGGMTWQPIHYLNDLVIANQISIWGCFMHSKDTVFVVGGGCIDSRIIWRSIDGGDTWQASVLDNHPLPNGNIDARPRLTHIIMNKNGVGYAVSSGLIWITRDFGDSWASYSRTESNFAWQESIAHIWGTNTFLVPVAGTTCQGGGNEGAMIFTNNAANDQTGANWRRRHFTTNQAVNMGANYGAWLISETEGWGAGTNRGVYHTVDAGNTWQIKNCGIDIGDNLDDIFFLNPTTGWVVGDNIYRLAPTQVTVSKDTIIHNYCQMVELLDTVIVNIKTFNTSILDIQIIKNNPNFQLVTSAQSLRNQPACGTARIITRLKPQDFGLHEFALQIRVFPDGEEFQYIDTIYYRALIKEGTVQTSLDTLDFGDVPVGNARSGKVRWTSNDVDSVVSFTVDNLDQNLVRLYNSMPFVITAENPNEMEFEINPNDTGEIFIHYKFRIIPCEHFKEIVLRVRGVSPILEANKQNLIDVVACLNDTIFKIPVFNLGNDTLIIYDFEIEFDEDFDEENSEATVEILGIGKDFIKSFHKIPPKNSDTLFIKISSNENKVLDFNVLLNNSDRRRAKSENPYKISVTATFKFPSISPKTQIIVFGDVCVYYMTMREVSVKNTGELTLNIPYPQTILDEFIFLNLSPVLTHQISPNDSIIYSVEFAPKTVGNFVDTVKFIAQPCDTEYEIILIGRGVFNEIEISPQEINDKINIKIAKEYQIKIKSNSPQLITVDSLKLLTVQGENEVILLTEFPFNLQTNEEKTITVSAYSEEEKIVIYSLQIYYSSSCFDSLKIPIQIEFIDNKITYTDKFDNPVLNFSDNYSCEKVKIFDTIYVQNLENYIFQNLHFANSLSEFKIENILYLSQEISENLPKEIVKDSKIEIIISFEPTAEGIFEESLIFEMTNFATNETQFDTLYFSKTFRKSEISISENLFDFGLFELCEEPIERMLIITNTGTLNDTTIFNISNLSNCFSFIVAENIFENSFEIEIPANETVEIKIILNPQLAEPKTLFSDSFKILTKVCPKEFDVNLKYQSEEISLTVSPKTLDFGDVWINTEKFETVIITNNSIFEVEISDFLIEPNIYFSHSETLPFILQSGQSKQIQISFISDFSDDFEATVNIFANRFCEISETVLLKATVPDERYTVEIIWSKTQAVPGKNAVIEATVAKPIYQLSPTQIDFHIKMDYKLFYPEKLFFIDENDNAKQLEFAFKYPAGLTSSLSENDAKTVMNFGKTFLRMEGLALLSDPKTTEIEFEKFEISTEKVYTVEQEEGEFAIYGFCEANGYRSVLKFLPTFESTVPSIINSNELEIIFDATDKISITVEVLNLLGETIKTENFDLEKGENKFVLNLGEISNGVYYVSFTSDFGTQQIHKFIVTK